MSENVNGKMVLEELRSAFDKVYIAGDALDTKLSNLLTFSSLIVSFAATVQISTLQEKVGVVFWALLGIVFLLYLANFYLVTSGLKPREYIFAIRFDRDTIEQKYLTLGETQMMNQVISNYLDSLCKAVTANDLKVSAIKHGNRLLFAIVVLLLIAIPLGLLYPKPTLFEFFHI